MVYFGPTVDILRSDLGPFVKQHLGTLLARVVDHAVKQRGQILGVLVVGRRAEVKQCLQKKKN